MLKNKKGKRILLEFLEDEMTYLPKKRYVTRKFIDKVLSGEKKVYKKSEILYTSVPRYNELSAKLLWA